MGAALECNEEYAECFPQCGLNLLLTHKTACFFPSYFCETDFSFKKQVNGIHLDLLLAFMILRRTDLPVTSQDLGPFPFAGGNIRAGAAAPAVF